MNESEKNWRKWDNLERGDRAPDDYAERISWQYPLSNRFSLLRTNWKTSLPEGYHGRFELLTLEDFCFLNACGISVL